MIKIYLSPSNQDGNMYAYGNTNECEQCNRIAECAKKALQRCGFDVKKAVKGQNMYTSINESNSWGADLHIPIHTNAGGGNGTVVFVYSKATGNMKFANPIYKQVQNVSLGTIDYGVREYPELAELNSTNAIAVYIEVDFHDNANIAKWIIENVDTIGEAIAKGVCEGYNIKYIEPNKNKEPNKTTKTSANSDISKKSNLQIAFEVIQGKYGSGATRKQNLGVRYADIQSIVNVLMMDAGVYSELKALYDKGILV